MRFDVSSARVMRPGIAGLRLETRARVLLSSPRRPNFSADHERGAAEGGEEGADVTYKCGVFSGGGRLPSAGAAISR